MKFEEIKVSPELEFHDISDELYREYHLKWGGRYRIVRPIALHVSESHSHRVIDADGASHYIQAGVWVALTWKVKENGTHHIDVDVPVARRRRVVNPSTHIDPNVKNAICEANTMLSKREGGLSDFLVPKGEDE